MGPIFQLWQLMAFRFKFRFSTQLWPFTDSSSRGASQSVAVEKDIAWLFTLTCAWLRWKERPVSHFGGILEETTTRQVSMVQLAIENATLQADLHFMIFVYVHGFLWIFHGKPSRRPAADFWQFTWPWRRFLVKPQTAMVEDDLEILTVWGDLRTSSTDSFFMWERTFERQLYSMLLWDSFQPCISVIHN